MSYEKFVMDVDQLGGFHTLARGITLDENAFALEAFREVGPGKPLPRVRTHARQLPDRLS